jgi:hypothetical protein
VTADGGLSYFPLSGVPFSCLPKGELLDAVAFFEPPEVPRETTGQFQFMLTVSTSPTTWAQVNVSGRLVEDDLLDGELHITTIPSVVCDDELLLSWSAQAIPATPTPVATASPRPPAPTASPASTAGPAALPPAGSGGGSADIALPLLLSLAGLAAFAAGLRRLLR